jgi:hypothetical protein
MSNEMVVYEQSQDIVVARPPSEVLADARKAAIALQDVVSKKRNPVIFNKEQYLEFEDWQTVGRFYGVTAKVMHTEFIDYGSVQGFEARAVAIRADGMEISSADAMCLNDEPNWAKKPLFQLRSMAQTRACSKALRNVLAWVVVLAGYIPTPAEEMTGGEHNKGDGWQKTDGIKEPGRKSEGEVKTISDAQQRKIYAQLKQLGITEEEKHGFCGLILEREMKTLNELSVSDGMKLIDGLTQRIAAQGKTE